MFDLRLTRWLDNLDGYSMFLVTLTFIIKILEVIGHNCIWRNIKNGKNSA